jgi:hypothetical protein
MWQTTIRPLHKRDLEMFRTRFQGLKSGRLKFGKSVDGVTWTDTTDEDIAFAELKTAELETSILGLQCEATQSETRMTARAEC